MDDITMEEIMRRYRMQREMARQNMLQAGMAQGDVDAWQERTARPVQDIQAPFTPQGKAMAQERARRMALDRLAGRGR